MCGFYCIAFIEYVLEVKNLLDYINLYCPKGYKKDDKIIYKYFKGKCDRKSKPWDLLILVSRVSGCVLVSAFAPLVCVPVGITSSAVGIKIVTARIKRQNQLSRKRKRSMIKQFC